MASIVHQTDKRSGITYAYESAAYWDKQKKQSRSKRRLIGRVDSLTGQIVPTDGRGHKRRLSAKQIKKQPGRPPSTQTNRFFYGATYLFDQIGHKLQITGDLKRCFPAQYEKILSLAYYLILEGRNPLDRFEKWSTLHKHPYGKPMNSGCSTELFASITEEAKQQFFHLQAQRRTEKAFWAYDTTPISSYSEYLRQTQYVNDQEDVKLPQMNIALVFGEQSNLPVDYRKLAGKIPDVKTIKHLLGSLNTLSSSKVKLVMDRSFYSVENINALLKEHVKFLVSVSMSLTFVRQSLEGIHETTRSFEHYSEKYELYCRTMCTTWPHQQEKINKQDIVTSPKRVYLHSYYSPDQAAEDEKNLDRNLFMWRSELLSGHRVVEHEIAYKKFFCVKTTPKRGTQVKVLDEAIQEAKRNHGYFALLTNDTMDAVTALELYRNKDVAENVFDNIEERLNMRRVLESSEQSLDGKLFVEFVALIFLSYIKKQMQDSGLFKHYSIQSALDELESIELFETAGRQAQIGQVFEKQESIYRALGIASPTSR